MKSVLKGPLQLAIHVVQNRHARQQKSHFGQDKQKTYIILNGNFLCLSCPIVILLSSTVVWYHMNG